MKTLLFALLACGIGAFAVAWIEGAKMQEPQETQAADQGYTLVPIPSIPARYHDRRP